MYLLLAAMLIVAPDPALEALFNPLPLRVGTQGASVYHRPFCPYAQRSLATHGPEKRINWFSVQEIPSNRVSDEFCRAGKFDCSLDGFVNRESCRQERRAISIPSLGGVCDVLQDFTGMNNGDDPEDWFDTGAGNSLNENDNFVVAVLGSNPAFSTSSALVNIHSHYLGNPHPFLGQDYPDFEITGRVRITEDSGIGLTFLSDFPNSDSYYRIRTTGALSEDLHFSSHGDDLQNDNTSLGVRLTINEPWKFRVNVSVGVDSTLIKARFWRQSDTEPLVWQLDLIQNQPSRYTQGVFGVWSMGTGTKYWDDFNVSYSPCNSLQFCEWSGYSAVIADDCSGTEREEIYFNALPNGIGDANGDAVISEEDFDYLIQCLRDKNNTDNCVNVFDFDNDGIVDHTDTITFLSAVGASNAAWVFQNQPDAVENSVNTPYRVGMIGSDLYHLPGCRYVENSRTNHGNHKYIEFYSKQQVLDSGRSPNTVGGTECDASIE